MRGLDPAHQRRLLEHLDYLSTRLCAADRRFVPNQYSGWPDISAAHRILSTEQPMHNENNFNDAVVIAAAMHDGHVDKGGNNYLTHVTDVANTAMFAARSANYAPELVERIGIVAVLHDVLEDTDPADYNERNMRAQFGDEVTRSVLALTKGKTETKEAYYQRVLADPVACFVKLHDVTSNANLARLNRPATQVDYDRRDYYMGRAKLLSDHFAKEYAAGMPRAQTYAEYLASFDGQDHDKTPLTLEQWTRNWGKQGGNANPA